LVNQVLDADGVIALLGLARHPEGGWFRETWRDEASTTIWFLLRHGERSAWHRVIGSTEVWHHYLGDALTLCVSIDGTSVTEAVLGPDLAAGQRPQAIVPAGAWQSAEPTTDDRRGYALVGCTVAPPFRFDAFELAPAGWHPG
jgi:predicted cupin superfamily sugar epimerase